MHRFKNHMPLLASVALAASFFLPTLASADTVSVNFEPTTYTVGNINGQDGWTSTGAYDQGVVSSPVISGLQSFRISDAVTSGAFGDQTFAKPLTDSVGETAATNGTFSAGTKQTHFETQFDIASAVPGAQQPGMHLSVSPDRGDGSRMSYLRFDDMSDGIHVFFDDVTDPTFGNAASFNETDIATISRSAHTIKLTMDVVDGPANDVVKVYIDGVLKITGTSWEDYYRNDPEAAGEQSPRIVKTVEFRESGAATPADLNNGFLIDNFSLLSGPSPVFIDPNHNHVLDGGEVSFPTIQAAVNAAVSGDWIQATAGTYPEHVAVNKSLTITGANAGIAGNGVRGAESIVNGGDTGTPFAITANDVTIDGFTVENGSNGGLDAGIWSQSGTQNSSILNNIITQNAFGVWAQCGGNCLIQGNLFDGNNKVGTGAGSASISADSTTGLTINNNEFKNDTAGNPILMQAAAPGAHTSLVVSNNNFHDNTNSNAYILAVTGGTFSGNTITPASGATGISFSGADANITVTGNTITGGARGIRIEDAGYYDSSGGNSNITINKNSLATDSEYGAGNLSGYTGNVDATCNWWGAASGPGPVGPGSGSPVTSNVDYSTWLTTSALDGPCNGPLPAECNANATQAIVSDTSTQDTTDNQAAVPVTPHSAWLANVSIPGATWIWNAEKGPATDDSGSNPPGTVTFTRPFTIVGTPTGATLDITTDNSYVVTINGNPVGSDGTWQTVETYVIPAADLLPGTNVLTVVATNDGPDGPGNPAGLLYKLTVNNNECVAPQPSVYISKYVDGVQATAGNANSVDFPMLTTFTSTAHGNATDAPYTLGAAGWPGSGPYQASFPNANVGADYATHEVTGGSVVGASCADGKPFALVGYTTGNTQALAAAGTPSATVPSFTNLQSDKYVIVWNATCQVTPPSTFKVHILKYLDGVEATPVTANNYQFPMTATWNATNIGAGTGNYPLGNNFGGAASLYGADTAAMTGPYDYSTSEVTDASSQVVALPESCVPGKYLLNGYRTSTISFGDAATELLSATAPSYSQVSADQYVIVDNSSCPTTASLTITKASSGGNGTFNFTSDIPGHSSFSITTANNTGSISFSGIVPGTYHVTEAAKSGWTQTDTSCASVALAAGDDIQCTVVNTNNKLLGSIRGTKYEDRDGDGTLKDGDHHRLGGVTVYLDSNNNGALDSGEPTTVTNSHGLYIFVGLIAGTYHVREVVQPGWTQTVPSSGVYNVTLAAGQNAKQKDFGNFKPGTVSGMKFNDLNGNHKKDAGEVGLGGWTINLKGPHGFTATTVTAADGSYSFSNLAAGNYTLSEVMQPTWRQTLHPNSVTVRSSSVLTNKNFGNTQKPKGRGDHDNDDGYRD